MPFPYKSPQRISTTDLTDLEYHFMFLQKPRASVSLDPANGVYYEMRYTEKGIEGKLRKVDMAPIIVPEGDMTRPIKRENLFEVDLSSKWLPRLRSSSKGEVLPRIGSPRFALRSYLRETVKRHLM